MKSGRLAVVACIVLAGCATQEPMSPELQKALANPSSAPDCRMVYRQASEDADRAQSSAAVGTSLGTALAATIGAGIGRGIAERRLTNELMTCYDKVGAAPNERLPVRGPNGVSEAADMAAIMGTAPAPKSRVAVSSNPARRGSGGGAGFSTF